MTISNGVKLTYIANARIPTEKAHGIQIMKMCEAFASLDNHGSERTDNHGLLYEDFTYRIRRCIFKVYNTLGFGHKESVYQKALEHELRNEGLNFESQKSVDVYYKNEKVSNYRPDFIIENKVIIEIKASEFLPKKYESQALHYLKGTHYQLALLVNFGSPRLNIRRLVWFPDGEYGANPWKSDKNQWKSIEVELIVPRRLNRIKEDPFDYYGVKRNFKIKKLPCLDLIPLDKYIGHLGLWIESVSFFFPALFYILFERIDVVYTRDKFLLPLAFLKKNFFFEAHTFPGKYFLYSLFLKRAKGTVVITRELKNLFREKKIAEDKILIAPDGVDLESFDIKEDKEGCRKKLGLSLDKKIVLYAGHLYEWKGAAVLLEAARNFQFPISNFQNVLFIFVGGTEKDTESFKQKAAILNNVMVVGHRPHSEIPYWLKAADVLVLPNSGKEDISKHWTSPLKMFEYMASRRPIVASDLPSIREILGKDNAVLVKPDDPRGLAERIKNVLENERLAGNISDRAFRDIQEHSWQKRAQNITDFLFYRAGRL